MQRIFIKPAAGKVVRDPVTRRRLPEDGVFVSVSTYWRRRLKDGSVTKSRPAAEKKPAAEPKKPDDVNKPKTGKGGE